MVTTILRCVDDVKDSPAEHAEPPGPRDRDPDPLGAWVVLGAEPGVAPGRLERVRALLNTDDRYHGVDALAGTAPTELVALRDALRAYVESGRPGDLADLALRHPVVVGFADGAARLVPAPGGSEVAGMCADVLATVHEAHLSGAWSRLKVCGNPDCRWVYHDASRNRSGLWCAMGECGDVMKARAYRRRVRAGTASARGDVQAP